MSTSFYVIIRPSMLEAKKLTIPENFVRQFGHELGDVATLTVPNGYMWEVGLAKDGKNKIWFVDGWHEFVEYHSIVARHFLVFKYGRDSTFQVLIFDVSASEIDYPFNKPQNLVNHDETENDNSVKIVDLTSTLNPQISSSENRVFDGCPKKRSRNKMYTSHSSQNLGKSSLKRSKKCATFLQSTKFKHGYEMQSKKFKMVEQVEINESDYVNCRRRGKLNIYEKDEFFVLLKHMGIFISESFRRFTLSQRQRALNVARLLKPKNPSFLVMVTETDAQKGFVYVPIKFSRKYFIEVEGIIILDSDEKVLPMEHKWSQGKCLLTRWTGVCNDKNLVAGDICIFEMIQLTKKNAFLKVSVFHAEVE